MTTTVPTKDKRQAKRDRQTSRPGTNKYAKERIINRWINRLIRENNGDEQQRIELTVKNTKYSNMPEWTYNFRDSNPGHSYLKKIFTKNNGQKEFEVLRIQSDGIVVELRGFKDIQEFDVHLDYFSNIHYNFNAGFWKPNAIDQISNSVTAIRYYEADDLSGYRIDPTFINQQEVNEAFVAAELERCKRKPGGKRKQEEVNKEAGQGKRPRLKKESSKAEKQKGDKKENAENRLKKEKLLIETHKTQETLIHSEEPIEEDQSNEGCDSDDDVFTANEDEVVDTPRKKIMIKLIPKKKQKKNRKAKKQTNKETKYLNKESDEKENKNNDELEEDFGVKTSEKNIEEETTKINEESAKLTTCDDIKSVENEVNNKKQTGTSSKDQQ